MERNDYVIEINNLTKSYGKKVVLDDINLMINYGETVGLIGRNSAGKTTIMNILLGNLKFDKGNVKILGKDPFKNNVWLKEKIGFVPERPSFYRWIKIGDLIRFVESFYQDWDRKRENLFLERFDLCPKQKISTLSRGELAKVSLLLVFARTPETILLDDPALGLDYVSRKEIIEILIDLIAERRRNILISSHFLDDLERIIDRVAILHQGKVVLFESMETLANEARLIRIHNNDQLNHQVRDAADILKSYPWGYEIICFSKKRDIEEMAKKYYGDDFSIHSMTLGDIFEALTSQGEKWWHREGNDVS